MFFIYGFYILILFTSLTYADNTIPTYTSEVIEEDDDDRTSHSRRGRKYGCDPQRNRK